MATVTGLTAERMLAIERASITQGAVDLNGDLQLTNFGGQSFNAGRVRGAPGPQGEPGLNGLPGLDASYEPIPLEHARLLDTYDTPGFYIQTNNNSAAIGYGYPQNQISGWLEISASADRSTVYQRYTSYVTTRIWIRSRVAGAWNAWSLFEPQLTPPAWTALTLSTAHKNNSTSYPCGYRVYNNQVFLRGLISPASGSYTASTAYAAAFQMGLGIRPLQAQFFTGSTTTGQSNCAIVITAAGTAELRIGNTAATYVSLDNVSYFYV